jgi:hypothetical protein
MNGKHWFKVLIGIGFPPYGFYMYQKCKRLNCIEPDWLEGTTLGIGIYIGLILLFLF